MCNCTNGHASHYGHDNQDGHERSGCITRRQFIRSVITAGVVFYTGVLYAGPANAASPSTSGAVEQLITLTAQAAQSA